MTQREPLIRRSEREPVDVHTWFSLTYANYLVAPRSVLQSMPEEWQHRFTALMEEMDEAFGHLEWPHYEVRALKRAREYIHHELCETCDGTGLLLEGGLPIEPRTSCEDCAGDGEVETDRYETAEEVGFRDDPIPHYNRGRTKLEPRNA